MRRITLALIALTICTAASAQNSLLAKISLDHKLTTTEAAAAVLIGSALGIKVEWVIGASRDAGVHLHNIGPAIVISHHSGYSLHDVLRQKPKGEGWGNVAKRLGMHLGTFNKMRVKGNDFENNRPTAKQMQALRRLIAFLTPAAKIDPARIYGHREITHKTACPGRLQVASLRRSSGGISAAAR